MITLNIDNHIFYIINLILTGETNVFINTVLFLKFKKHKLQTHEKSIFTVFITVQYKILQN